MAEFMNRCGSAEQCEAALAATRWPKGFACPRCGRAARTSFRRGGRLYWECADCGHQCSLTSGTIFAASKLPLTSWFLAMHLLTLGKNNVATLELKRHVGVYYRTAWLVKHKLMQAMQLREASRQLSGRVEVDDAYLGGERSGGKPGGGSGNRVPFIAAVQMTESGQPHLACFAPRPFTQESFSEFMAESMPLPLTGVFDGLGCFTITSSMGAVHDRTVTGGGKLSVKLEQFWAVNTVLSSLKTALSGTYHAVKIAKYAARYLGEAQFPFNPRYDLRAILRSLVRAVIASPACREGVLRSVEVHR